MVRVPGFPQEYFNRRYASDAMARRDELCAKVGRSANDSISQKGRVHQRPHSDKKIKLPVGIGFRMSKKVLTDGAVVFYPLISSHSITLNRRRSWQIGRRWTLESAAREAVLFRKANESDQQKVINEIVSKLKVELLKLID
jgi:hypothetical protein